MGARSLSFHVGSLSPPEWYFVPSDFIYVRLQNVNLWAKFLSNVNGLKFLSFIECSYPEFINSIKSKLIMTTMASSRVKNNLYKAYSYKFSMFIMKSPAQISK